MPSERSEGLYLAGVTRYKADVEQGLPRFRRRVREKGTWEGQRVHVERSES